MERGYTYWYISYPRLQNFGADYRTIAIPRYLEIDDEYKGYRIPAGSVIIPNAW